MEASGRGSASGRATEPPRGARCLAGHWPRCIWRRGLGPARHSPGRVVPAAAKTGLSRLCPLGQGPGQQPSSRVRGGFLSARPEGLGSLPHSNVGVHLHTHGRVGGPSPYTQQEGLPLRRALPLGDGKVAQRQQIMGALSREKPTWTNREKQPPPEQKGPEASEPLVVLDRRDPGWAAAGEGAALALVVEGGWPRGPGTPETNPRGAGDPGVPVLILPTPRPAGSRRPVRGQPGAAGRPHGSHHLRSVQPEDAQGPGSRAGQWGTRV